MPFTRQVAGSLAGKGQRCHHLSARAELPKSTGIWGIFRDFGRFKRPKNVIGMVRDSVVSWELPGGQIMMEVV